VSLRVCLARITAALPHFKGKFHITNLLTPRMGKVWTSVAGYQIELDLADLVQRHTFMRTWEVPEVRLLPRLLPQGGVFLDVGANFGYYTAVAARHAGQAGQVYAFEPEPTIFRKLSAWVSHGRVSQVRCLNVALSDEAGTIQLYVPPAWLHNHDASVFPYCDGMTELVAPRTTIDEFLRSNPLERVDLMKLDVEGHEWEVLWGARHTLQSGRIKNLLCEFNPQFGDQCKYDLDDLYQMIVATGFQETPYRGGPPPFPQIGRGIPNRLFQWVRYLGDT